MNTLFPLLAVINGSIIAIMILFNTLLAGQVGLYQSILIIQASGLVLSGGILLVIRPKGSAEIPFARRLGGVLGVPIVLLNTICFQAIGASLTLACGVLSQSAASATADVTGFLGVKKYSFERRKLIGFAISLTGIILMGLGGEFRFLYVLLALVAGVVTIIQMIINSTLAVRIGILKSTFNNFIGGVAAALALLLVMALPLSSIGPLLRETPFYLIVAGGWLGVAAVLGCNLILPRIPTVYSSLLQFSGQILAALIIDTVRFGSFSIERLIGVLLILSGMYVNIRFDLRKNR